jgi:hypothetical protein
MTYRKNIEFNIQTKIISISQEDIVIFEKHKKFNGICLHAVYYLL